MMGFLCAWWRMIMMGSFTDDDDDDDDGGGGWWWMIMMMGFIIWLDKGWSGAGSNWSESVSESGGSNFFLCRKLWCSAVKFEIMKRLIPEWMDLDEHKLGCCFTYMMIMIWYKYLWHHHPTHGQVTHKCLWHHHQWVGWVTQVLVTTSFNSTTSSSSMSWMSDATACDNIIASIINELDEQHKCLSHHHWWVGWVT